MATIVKDVVMLADGTYDAIVVDATGDPLRLELAILGGPHKGEVVALRASGVAGAGGDDPIDLLGVPATIVVTDGEPTVTLEP